MPFLSLIMAGLPEINSARHFFYTPSKTEYNDILKNFLTTGINAYYDI